MSGMTVGLSWPGTRSSHIYKALEESELGLSLILIKTYVTIRIIFLLPLEVQLICLNVAFTADIYQRSAPAIDKRELLSGAAAVIYLHVKQTLTSGWMNSTLKSIDCID